MAEEQGTNEVVDEEEKKAKDLLAKLEAQAHEGAMFADWAKQYCSVKVFRFLDSQINDTKNAWLTAENREKAEAVRLESRAYAKVKGWIYAQIKAGELAGNEVRKFKGEGIELEGVIKQPPPAKQADNG